MAVSFLTRLQQTINTALSPDPQVSVTGPVPGSPSTPTLALSKSVCSQETPTKPAGVITTSTTIIADGNTSAPTPHPTALGPVLGPVVVERERGRSPTTPSHLDARLPIEGQDIFSPSDRTITQSQPQVQTLMHLPPGSVVADSSRGTDSTPSTATVRRYERSAERREEEEEVLRDGEGAAKRRRKKRGVNEVGYLQPCGTSFRVLVVLIDIFVWIFLWFCFRVRCHGHGSTDACHRQATTNERTEEVDESADPAGARC